MSFRADLVKYVNGERRLVGVAELSVIQGQLYNPILIIGEAAAKELGIEIELRGAGKTYEIVVTKPARVRRT